MESFAHELEVPGREDARLRILGRDDWRIEYDLSRVADVPTWTMYAPDLTEELARARAEHNVAASAAGVAARYIVEEAGTALGTAGFGMRGDRDFEVFYAMKPEGRGRGLATDAVLTIVGWLRRQGEQRVWLSTLDGNTASERLADRVGFVRVGAGVHTDGRPITEWLLTLPTASAPSDR